MQSGWFTRLGSVVLSLLLHIVVIGLLIVSFDMPVTPVALPPPRANIVNAVSVDKKQVEQELQKIKQQEDEKKQAEQNRIKELERKAQELKQQRQDEEKKLKIAKQQKEQEQKKREVEQKKLAAAEQQRKAEEEKQKQAEAERQKAEAEKQKAEAEKKRIEEEQQKAEEKRKQEEEAKKKAEEEKKRAAAEKALQDQLDAEQVKQQQQQDATLLQKIAAEIYSKVKQNFNETGLPDGLSCEIHVKLLPGGEVIDASISKSSGNDIFDRRAVTAVQKASPLPVPEDTATLDRLKLRDITFVFKP